MAERKTKKKVAIVGFTPSRAQAPYDDESFEVWGLNALYKFPEVTRATRWFDVHAREKLDQSGRVPHYADMGIPVYLQEPHPDIPESVAFPKAEIEAELGDRYFTNSISWMIALAIHEGFDEIHVYGVDMATPDEYFYQRNNLEYWLGIAKGRGIEVYVPESCDLLKTTHQYGYGSDNGLRVKLDEKESDLTNRIDDITRKIQQHQAEIQKLTNVRCTLDGARQNTQWMKQSLTIPDAKTKGISPFLKSVEDGPDGDGGGDDTGGGVPLLKAVG